MNKNHIIILIILIVVGTFLFYWYEYRPSQIKQICNKATTFSVDYKNDFQRCLDGFGL